MSTFSTRLRFLRYTGTKVFKQSKEKKKTTNLHEVNNPNFHTVNNKQVFHTIAYF